MSRDRSVMAAARRSRIGRWSAGLLALGAFAGAAVVAATHAGRVVRPAPSGPHAVAALELRLERAAERALPVRVWHPVGMAGGERPLVLYAPSWSGARDENDVLLAEIASFGFVAVATDDVGLDAPPSTIADPADEAARVSLFRLGSADEFEAFQDIGRRRSRLGREKLSQALDRLQALPGGGLPVRIDFRRVAVVGFSHGGAVAGAALASDVRIKAAVNLDGWVIGTEGGAPPAGRPMLAIYADPGLSAGSAILPAAAWSLALTRLDFEAQLELSGRSAARSILIEGVSHDDFKDTLYEPGRWLHWRPWRPTLPADTMRQALHGVVVAFLRSSLDEAREADWMDVVRRFPAMRPLAPPDAQPS